MHFDPRKMHFEAGEIEIVIFFLRYFTDLWTKYISIRENSMEPHFFHVNVFFVSSYA